jgi:hypothetical protein
MPRVETGAESREQSMTKHVAVLMGGLSVERDVSLRSASM